MYRPIPILIALLLIFGAPRECAGAGPAGEAERAESDSVEISRNDSDVALERSDQRFLPVAGKRVRKIRIKSLAVFGASVDDTTRVAKSRLMRFLNNLNFRTLDGTVRQNLLFKEGEAIDPLRLADSERILRNLPYIGDARIVVEAVPAGGDSADVRIIVKEAWTLNLSGSVKEGNRVKVNLAEKNLLGLGHHVSAAATLIPDAHPRLGVNMSYSVQNIRGSFTTGKLDYAKKSGHETSGFALSRELVSPALNYAGGLDLRRTMIAVKDSLPSTADNTSDLIDLWAGRQFHLSHRQQGVDRGRTLFASGRIRRLRFTNRPPVTPSTFYQYHDINHLLGSLAFIQNRYYRTNLLYNFGRTEDIPYGFLARVTYGLADEEFVRSTYASSTLAAGDKIGGLGYCVGEVRVGGYPKAGKLTQGVLRMRTLYFSNLLHAGGFRFRQFVNAEYVTGIHRSADDSIDFGGDQSIRGVAYDNTVTGSKRLQLNLETVAFTPWRARGVTCALFTFADLDVIGTGRTSIFEQDYYSGLGLGVRLHKDSWGIGPVQLRFAWYPRLPIDHDALAYTAFGEKRFRSVGFVGGSPEIVEY